MYFVGNKSFENMSDAMECCSKGSVDDIVTDENGAVLMRHEEVPIEEILELMLVSNVLQGQNSRKMPNNNISSSKKYLN